MDYLHLLEQEHLISDVEKLSEREKEYFFSQIRKYTPEFVHEQRALLKEGKRERSIDPLQEMEEAGSFIDQEVGESLIREGKVGCLILSGGQGSRLKGKRAKALMPISLIEQKTLVQLFLERVAAYANYLSTPLPVALMVSPLNRGEIEEYLEGNGYFGVSQVSLFSQEVAPFINKRGEWFLSSKKLAEGPNGNGHALSSFYHSGIWEKWKNKGVEYLNVIMIDNPLADPFDPQFIGFQKRKKSEVAIKCISRTSPEESLGVVGKVEGEISIIEYSELSEEKKNERKQGELSFRFANTGLFSFTFSFIEKVADKHLPWHLAWKEVDIDGRVEVVGKSETFLFDLFKYADSLAPLHFSREEIYAPLKNAEGNGSLETVQKALLERDRKLYFSLTGKEVVAKRFELDPLFYYPSEQMRQMWKGKEWNQNGYIKGEL